MRVILFGTSFPFFQFSYFNSVGGEIYALNCCSLMGCKSWGTKFILCFKRSSFVEFIIKHVLGFKCSFYTNLFYVIFELRWVGSISRYCLAILLMINKGVKVSTRGFEALQCLFSGCIWTIFGSYGKILCPLFFGYHGVEWFIFDLGVIGRKVDRFRRLFHLCFYVFGA